jgi:hypothetical protein
MIVAIRHDEWYGGKSLQNLCGGFRAREALQKLLENEARCQKHLACLDGPDKRLDFLGSSRRAAPKRE